MSDDFVDVATNGVTLGKNSGEPSIVGKKAQDMGDPTCANGRVSKMMQVTRTARRDQAMQ